MYYRKLRTYTMHCCMHNALLHTQYTMLHRTHNTITKTTSDNIPYTIIAYNSSSQTQYIIAYTIIQVTLCFDACSSWLTFYVDQGN